MRPVLSNMMGAMGQHMEILVFPSVDKAEHLIADPKSDGSLTVHVGDIALRYRLPLGSILSPSLDLKTGRVVSRQLSLQSIYRQQAGAAAAGHARRFHCEASINSDVSRRSLTHPGALPWPGRRGSFFPSVATGYFATLSCIARNV